MLLDLSRVTQALLKLLTEGFKVSTAWLPDAAPTVSPLPPDKLPADSLGLYLYHVSENPGTKNLPAVADDPPPIRFTPMGLDLHYLLTTNSKDNTAPSALRAQRMMSCAVKVLHDHAVIDDDTEINTVPILSFAQLDGAENTLRVYLQPKPYEEAVGYWTAGTTPLRLSAYYEVSVVYLEPDTPQVRRGRVLTYGVFPFVAGQPRLTGSRSQLTFTVPGESEPTTVEVTPAQVPVGGQVTFLGSDLSGDRVALRLQSTLWDEPVEVDSTWGVSGTGDRLLATVQTTAEGRDVLPGTYSAAAKITSLRPSGGTVRSFSHLSNVTPFTITPRIASITGPAGNNLFTVTGYIFDHADLPQEAVQVYLGADRLTRKNTPLPAAGEFVTTAPETIKLRLPAGTPPGVLPVRVLVAGAESPPNWIEVK